jgi:hypothetical protein
VSNGPTVGRDGVVVLQAVAARKLPPGTSSAGSDVWKGAIASFWSRAAHVRSCSMSRHFRVRRHVRFVPLPDIQEPGERGTGRAASSGGSSLRRSGRKAPDSCSTLC